MVPCTEMKGSLSRYQELVGELLVLISNKKDRYFTSLSPNVVFKHYFLSCCVCMLPPDEGRVMQPRVGKSTVWKQYGGNLVD